MYVYCWENGKRCSLLSSPQRELENLYLSAVPLSTLWAFKIDTTISFKLYSISTDIFYSFPLTLSMINRIGSSTFVNANLIAQSFDEWMTIPTILNFAIMNTMMHFNYQEESAYKAFRRRKKKSKSTCSMRSTLYFVYCIFSSNRLDFFFQIKIKHYWRLH